MTRTVTGLGRTWVWPEDDKECIKVVFDWISDLGRTVHFCKQRRTAIQAGGNMGVWPWWLAQSFKRVITAEPDVECGRLLVENLLGAPNVDFYAAAFMDRDDWSLRMSPDGVMNRGAQYVEPFSGGDVKSITIDSLGVTDCDLIYLDIEGAELRALQGAAQTIRASKPVVAYEDKDLGRRFGFGKYDTEKWLEREFGYKVVARYHNDVVMTCES